MGKSIQPVNSTSGAKAQNVEWFASDIVVEDTQKLIISLAVSASVVVEITKNSGTDWVALNSNVVLIVDAEHIFDVMVRAGDTFNMRTPTGGGATLAHCRIDVLQSES